MNSPSWYVFYLECEETKSFQLNFHPLLGYMVSAIAVIFQIGVLVIISFVEWWLSKWLNVAAEPVKFQVHYFASHPGTPILLYRIMPALQSSCRPRD